MDSTLYEKCFDNSLWGHEEKLAILSTSISQINDRANCFMGAAAACFVSIALPGEWRVSDCTHRAGKRNTFRCWLNPKKQ